MKYTQNIKLLLISNGKIELLRKQGTESGNQCNFLKNLYETIWWKNGVVWKKNQCESNMNKCLVWFKIYQKKDNWEDIHNEVYDELSFFAWYLRYPVNKPSEFVESGAGIDIQMSEYFSSFSLFCFGVFYE